MDKHNINEELEKFRLLSSYSTKKTLSENIEQISEQYSSPEEEIFYTLARAASGPGTKKNLLIQAFQKFQNYAQLLKVEKMLNDRPIGGRRTLAGLLRTELDSADGETIKKIADAAKAKGISINYTMGGINKNQLDNNKITISPVQKTKPIGDVPVTGSGKSDEPTGDMAKVKDLEPVVVVGKKPSVPAQPSKAPVGKGQIKTSINPIKPEELYTPQGLPKGEIPNLDYVNKPSSQQDLSGLFDKLKASGAPAPAVQSLEQQFQTAKQNLDKAKSELDAAQATRDRAQIGAARGKQQAARAEVQRLRNELANLAAQQ